MRICLYLVLTCLIHVLLFISLFHIYFTTPVINNAQEFPPDTEPIASRLVLFVADGLRADALFSLDADKETYLRQVMMDEGMWGISHTKAPTESRPCHVSMTGGFHEDPTAIFTGWKKNPIEFDNVFNKSRTTWAFGSYEVLPVFSMGDASSHYYMHLYYGNNDDQWVYNKFESFLNKAKNDKALSNMLHKNKIIFFLHLVATDTFGHKYGSTSKSYRSNIIDVDGIVTRISRLITDFYSNDGRTSFVFVSDHGMTDEDGHGSGSTAETESPLVIWGSGVTKLNQSINPYSEFEKARTRAWQLDFTNRYDIDQVDLAPLMSLLLGLPVPTSSRGVFPVNILSVEPEVKAKLMFANAKQTCELFRVKMFLAHQKSILLFPYFKFSLHEVSSSQAKLVQLLEARRFDEVITGSKTLISLSLDAARFYHIHHRITLCLVLLITVLGWIIITCISFVQLQPSVQHPFDIKKVSFQLNINNLLLFAFSLLLLGLFHVYHTKSHIFYYISPLYIWYYIFKQRSFVLNWCSDVMHLVDAWTFIFYIICIFSLVLSFLYRPLFSVLLVCFLLLAQRRDVTRRTKWQWSICCLTLSIFPLLPIVSTESFAVSIVVASSFVAVMYGIKSTKRCNLLSIFLFVSGILVYIIRIHLYEFPIAVLTLSGGIISVSVVLSLHHQNSTPALHFLTFAISHFASYLLVSRGFLDILFFAALCYLLEAWILMEQDLVKSQSFNMKHGTQNRLIFDPHIWRISFMFVFFLLFSLFGFQTIRNLDKISGSVFAEIPQFSSTFPHLKMFLLCYKIFIPLLLVVYCVCCIAFTTNTNVTKIGLISLIIGEVMSIPLLFMICDSGSWADIGGSIARYGTILSLVVPVLGVFVVNKLFVRKLSQLSVQQTNALL